VHVERDVRKNYITEGIELVKLMARFIRHVLQLLYQVSNKRLTGRITHLVVKLVFTAIDDVN